MADAPTEHSEYLPNTFSAWTVSLVKTALAEHEQGMFQTSALLADAMRRDDAIFTTLETRTTELLGADFEMQPSKFGDQRMAQRVADDIWSEEGLSGWWNEAMPQTELADHLRWWLLMGFSLAELPYNPETLAGKLVPHLKVWNPQFLTYQSWGSNFTDRRWMVQTQDAGLIEVREDDSNWWLFRSSKSRPWMNGAIRACAVPFLIRQFALKDQGRAAEWAGQGVRKLKVPANAKKEDIAKYMRDVRNLAAEPTIKVPDGWDFELVNAVAATGAADLFEKLLDRCETSFMRVFLGQDGTTQAQSGLNAGAGHKVLAKTEQKRHEAGARALREGARRYVLMPYCEKNEGHREVAPFPKWDVAIPEDEKSKAETLDKLGDALPKLVTAGVDIEPIIGEFGLKLLTFDQRKKKAAEQAELSPVPAPGEQQGGNVNGDGSTVNKQGPTVNAPGPIAANRAESGVAMLRGGGRAPSGFVAAQGYADQLVDEATGEAAHVLKPDVEAVLAAINGAADYDAARDATTEAHASMSPKAAGEVARKALVMAEAAGHAGVREDIDA